jgi:hypothetical protein
LRKVYQGTKGGKIHVPLEVQGRVIGSSTPRFSKQVSWKYSQLSADKVRADLSENHGRTVSKGLIQTIGKRVGKLLIDKVIDIDFALPPKEKVAHISVGRDGTTTAVLPQGYRETMSGTISFYNQKSERIQTIYTAACPEYGKATFDARMCHEIQKLKVHYTMAEWSGIADGAKDNWTFLNQHTQTPILDFFHLSQYITLASECLFTTNEQQKKWTDKICHNLKEKSGTGLKLMKKLKKQIKEISDETKKQKVEKTISYLNNNIDRIDYPLYIKKGYPIGSGVTKAACIGGPMQMPCKTAISWLWNEMALNSTLTD